MIEEQIKPRVRPGDVTTCEECQQTKVIFCRYYCGSCYRQIMRHRQTRYPKGRGPGKSGRAPTPGKGNYLVMLCKPGDELQDEIPILRVQTAIEAIEECRNRNIAARERRSRSRCFYFVGCDRSLRLPWIERMIQRLDEENAHDQETKAG